MRQSVPVTEDTASLRARFITEAIAAIDTKDTYRAVYEALRKWLNALSPFSQWGDFDGDGEITLPEPYHILVEPSILYGYY